MSQYSKAILNDHTDLKKYIGKTYKYIDKGSIVLDVGCSTGYFGKLLIDEKKSVVDGVEFDVRDAKKAKKLLRSVYQFDLDGPVWPKDLLQKKYDIIFFGDVLEHLKDPGKVLKQFSNLLSTKGKVIISIPNIAHVTVRLELLAGNFDYEKLGILDETHLKYFTYMSFLRLLSRSGYKLIDYDSSYAIQPRSTIEEWLDKLGLKGSEKFYSLVNAPEATAYQYRFVATPGKMGKLPSLPAKPHEIAKKYMDEQKVENDKLKTELSKREKDIQVLSGSLSWKITKPLRTIKNMLGPRK